MPRLFSHTCFSVQSAASRRLCVASSLIVGVCALVPTIALADLYKWTDERGTMVLSNVPPANPKRVTNFEVVVKEPAAAPARGAPAQPHDVTGTEKLLLDRIDTLERQLQVQQTRDRVSTVASAAEAQYAAPVREYTGDAFYPGYPGYYPGYYPSYVFPYPPGYAWGYPFGTTVVVGSSFGSRHFGGRLTAPVHVVSRPASFTTSFPSGSFVIGGVRR